MFDYCMYQNYDYVQGSRPAYDLTGTILPNKAAGTEVGVLQYMRQKDASGSDATNRIRAVFKYIMYTWYEPNTFAAADQASILTKVYTAMGQPVPAPRGGLSTHTQASIIVPAMVSYFGGSYNLDATSTSAPPPPPPPPTPPSPTVSPDAACAALATKQTCSQCCDLAHKSAYQNIAKPVVACACSPATCATQCAASLCAGAQPDALCTACLVANPTCAAGVVPANAACVTNADCAAELTCFAGCAAKP
jgi:hypothetical protein